jgi:phosphoribosyl 1,2-cyclic phosphodiesterase
VDEFSAVVFDPVLTDALDRLELHSTRMSLELCILASGSSGNSAILRTPNGIVLIDAGIGPRTAAKRMADTGANLSDLRAVCVTHLDRDHLSLTWFETLARRSIALFCHETRLDDLREIIGDVDLEIRTFNGHPFEPVENVRFRAIPLVHDQSGSHGFLIDGFNCRVGYATDLGHVPGKLLDIFCGVDVLAIESNYDPQMEINSSRPSFLKQRIMGGKGHLSNQQAFDAIRAILDRCEKNCDRLPQHIVLLHRSRQCNCPKIVRRLFESDPRIAKRLTLAEQFERSCWLAVSDRKPLVGEQLLMY